MGASLGDLLVASWLQGTTCIREKGNKAKFGSVTFCCVVPLLAHYYGMFCVAKGMGASRSLGCHRESVIGTVKSASPSGQVRLGD